MIKVGLLGDSIRQIGYGTKVPELLGKDYTVFQPDDNCRFAKYTLRGIFDWKQQLSDCDIIHWNNGLWDVTNLFGDGTFSSPKEYSNDILRIGKLLKRFTPKVIFATTTPVRSNNSFNKNANIENFNSLVVPSLKDMGIIINDLYSAISSDIEKYIRADDCIHLTEAGIDVCAKQVVKVIKLLG